MGLSDKLKTKLGERIKQDMEPKGKWHPVDWFKTSFGDFYGKASAQLPIIHRVVGECVDSILKPDWQMTVASWQGLQRSVDATDTPESALPDMVRSALQVDPRNYAYFDASASVAESKPSRKKRKARTKKPLSKKKQ